MNTCRSLLRMILADIHYKKEDKIKLIGEMTIKEIKDRTRLSSQETARN